MLFEVAPRAHGDVEFACSELFPCTCLSVRPVRGRCGGQRALAKHVVLPKKELRCWLTGDSRTPPPQSLPSLANDIPSRCRGDESARHWD